MMMMNLMLKISEERTAVPENTWNVSGNVAKIDSSFWKEFVIMEGTRKSK